MAEDLEASVSTSGVKALSGHRRRWGVAIQVVVLGLLLALVFRFFDREQIALAFASVSLPSFLIFTGLMLSIRLVAAWRWLVVARDHVGLSGLSFGFMVRVELLADFAGIWMQTSIGGEAVRVWKIARRTGEKALGPGSVVLDRFIGLASLVVATVPFLVLLALREPTLALPEDFSVKLWMLTALAVAGAVAALFAWRYLETLRNLARRALETATKSRFMIVPMLISLFAYVPLVGAHYLGIPELNERPWVVAGIIAVVPRLGQAVPLSIFGVTAVEGAVFALGKLLEISPQTILVIVALNLTTRYLGSIVGALAEISLHGTRFFREVRKDRNVR